MRLPSLTPALLHAKVDTRPANQGLVGRHEEVSDPGTTMHTLQSSPGLQHSTQCLQSPTSLEVHVTPGREP